MQTTTALIQQVRYKLDDVVVPYLVSDAQIIEQLNWAQTTFAERTLCLSDSTNFPFSYTPGTEWLDLDEQILKIRFLVRADGSLIKPVSRAEIDHGFVTSDYGLRAIENWRTLTGRPVYAVTDLETYRVRLVPTPNVAESGYIECYRFPTSLDTSTDPEIPPRWHALLVDGAVMQLYRLQDVELYNPQESETWEMRWERGLAEALAALERSQRGSGVTRFNSTGVW